MTMVVQHLENRLALSSVHPNEQLHEFQIVHALITQCRKQVSCEDADSNCNGYQCPSPPLDQKEKSGRNDKGDKTSFVNTIRQTFNAIAQATNPSLCAKQNVTHPVSIASTVKNIISQFSRQTCHGSIYLSSPYQEAVPESNDAIKQSTPSSKIHNSNSTENESATEPSTSQKPVLERTEIKRATVVKQKSNSNLASTKPKAKVFRTRNANGLVRHESAPPAPDQAALKLSKKASSVRRSKSDAVCYQTRSKQNRRRIDSNVHTKVLHFEKSCEESMCAECRRRNLEDDTKKLPNPVSSPTALRADTIIPKQETFMGALSYHKPSIISQNVACATVSDESSNCATDVAPTDITKTGSKTPTKPKAIPCPGGTYFPSNGLSGSEIVPTKTGVPIAESIVTKDAVVSVELQSKQCPYANVIESSENQAKPHEKSMSSIENVVPFHKQIADDHSAGPDALLTKTSSESSHDINVSKSPSTQTQQASNNENLYTRLCSDENICDSLEPIDLGTVNYDSSDNIDSCSSSSSESVPSPRQEYTDRRNGLTVLPRRAPSARYKRIRRKLKKLITRSRSCVEVVQQEVFQTQAEREQEFLESLKIPTPTFMLPDGNTSFDIKREQLAMHFEKNKDYMKRLPDHVLVQIFSHLDTRSLAMLKCVCTDFNFLVNSYDIRGTDSLWVKDVRYMDDPCRFCRKKFSTGDVSMCRYHAKYYHCDLPYGRSYWMCCFQIEKNAPGCKTGIHDNRWALFHESPN